MPDIEICPRCGIPLFISSQHVWMDNGVIQTKEQDNQRLVFFECGNLDPLFDGISDIIDMSIEHLVIDASRRSTRSYMDHVVPNDIKEMIRAGEIQLDLVFDSTFLIWRAMGYGKLSLIKVRYEGEADDFITVQAERPYSVPLAVGNFAGSIQAVIGSEPGIVYEETRPGVYKITIFHAENPSELKDRLRWKAFEQEYKGGDIDLERCPVCNAPAALSEFHWDQANGGIRSTITGRRMVMTGPSMIDPIFDDLQEELGETIPNVVVEAQKRFIRSGFFGVEEVLGEDEMRTQLALRGLGNLTELKMGSKGVQVTVENTAIPLLMVGLAQGLFEKAFNKDSDVDWELTADGTLLVEVKPRF